MVSSAAVRPATAVLVALPWTAAAFAQAPEAGRRQFETTCASCHGGDGNGGERGPAIVTRLALRRDDELATFLREGLPAAGMPGFPIPDREMRELIAFLRTLRPKEGWPPAPITVQTTDGGTLAGVPLNRSSFDLQLLSLDHDRRVHLLRKEGERYRAVTSQADWPTYHGRLDGNRYSALDQINRTSVARLAPRWSYALPNVRDGRQRGPRARRRERPPHLDVPAHAHEGPGRRCRRGHQPRRRGGRRPRLHGHRPRPHLRARPLHGRVAMGHRDGRLAPELRRDLGAARRGPPGDLRHVGRR
ncbi:MAG: hypothetical protein DMF81_02725 [Acidobacteria bacterium]|nr:MAG: hypothetical protein DMF81_02725 [Acidobacteriota bacterium]